MEHIANGTTLPISDPDSFFLGGLGPQTIMYDALMSW